MTHRRQILTLGLMLLIIFAVTAPVQAASIKERMAARIPAINTMKDQGLIGENSSGLLEYRSSQRPSQAMIQEENNDRQTVYQAIAKKEGVSPQLVAERRAKMIADNGAAGHWFQAKDGKWYQK